MALKDSVDDVSGAHSFGVVEEDELDALPVEVLLVDLQALEVRDPRVATVIGVDDRSGPDEAKELALVAVVGDHDVDVLAG